MNQLDIFTSFHNTIPVQGNELDRLEAKARKQEEKILKLFEGSPYQSFTPFQVYHAFGQQWPITSVRRAMTNLTNQEKLVVTGERRKEESGAWNNCWRLKTK